MRNLSVLALAVLCLAVPTAATPDDAVPACAGTWLRIPTPHELAYTLDPWTVMLLADNQDPATMTYAADLISARPSPEPPFCWVGPGPQTHGPVVVARVGGNCWWVDGVPHCAAVTYRVRAVTAGGDCSEVVLAFPYDHAGGQ